MRANVAYNILLEEELMADFILSFCSEVSKESAVMAV
jgi:hypothetical protein